MRRLFDLLLHPMLLYAFIAFLSCLPKGHQEEILYEMPEAGDNFKTANDYTVYYFDGDAKHRYPTESCFFGFSNPPFETHYLHGGVKCIDEAIAETIPVGGDMCEESGKKQRLTKRPPRSLLIYLTKDFWLYNFANFAHLLFYALLTGSLLRYWIRRQHPRPRPLAFGLALLGGIALEVVQALWVTSRTASVLDVLWNMGGIVIALAVHAFFSRRKHKKPHP